MLRYMKKVCYTCHCEGFVRSNLPELFTTEGKIASPCSHARGDKLLKR